MSPGVRPGDLVSWVDFVAVGWQVSKPFASGRCTQADRIVFAIPAFDELIPARIWWRVIDIEAASINEDRVKWIAGGAQALSIEWNLLLCDSIKVIGAIVVGLCEVPAIIGRKPVRA